jgi:DUF971 family protein
MATAERITPRDINSFPNGEIGIVWEDGHESIYTGYYLRCNCNCAACVDEMTGVKILENEAVSRAVKAKEIHGVGRYGISIAWSDGHDTGIYTFEMLRKLCPCCE